MKFRFKGKKTLLIDSLTTDKIYNILQFGQHHGFLLVYVIDDKNELLCIPYAKLNLFNDNWEIVNDL